MINVYSNAARMMEIINAYHRISVFFTEYDALFSLLCRLFPNLLYKSGNFRQRYGYVIFYEMGAEF